MKIAILGATGTAGSPTVHKAHRAGHEVRALSRATGVDLHTGRGLLDKINDAEIVIDTSNAFPANHGADLVRNFTDVTKRIVEACRKAGVRRLVHLSICNIDLPAFDDFDYYLAKRAQEQVLAESELAHTIIRSTQWMEFALNPAAVTLTDDEVQVADWLIQPIAVSTVADVLVEALTDARDRQLAGPERIPLPELTRQLLAVTGDHRRVVETASPEQLDEAFLAPAEAEILGPTPEEWIARHAR